jgi:bla regulator protein blaR1
MKMFTKNLAQAALTAFTVTAAMFFSLLQSPQARAQSSPTAGAPSPAFEVASIKPNKSGDGLTRLMLVPDGLSANGIAVKGLIGFAYNVKDFQMSGGPGWIESEKYDIEAKMDEATITALKQLPPEQAIEQRRLMVRSLLAERFKLKVSHSSKEVPIYALVVAKNGPKFTKSADAPSGPGGPGQRMMRMQLGELTATGIPISLLADRISREVGRNVVDKTGLPDKYDFTLHWTSDRQGLAPGGNADGGPGSTAPPPDSSGPSIFTALQEQLGLKLESQKGPVETLIIDSVEKPSEN